MKTLRFFLIILAFAVLLVYSCDLFGVSIGSRVSYFQDELNFGRNLQSQFHPSIRPSYASYTPDSVFDSSSLGAQNGSYVITMTGSDQPYIGDIRSWDGVISCNNYGSNGIHFYFEQSGMDWYILAILLDAPESYNVGDYYYY
ncbi:MAG: hypothetical protein JXD23_16480 [Spirochaetales bacterium]|nr:hypothetical protein [Spirochaetales bacterium]